MRVRAYDLGSNAQFRQIFPAESCYLCVFLPPKVNCAIYSAWLVYACACIPLYACVCVSHICFKYMAALSLKMAAPSSVALVENLVSIHKKKQSLFTKNSDAIRGRAICQK